MCLLGYSKLTLEPPADPTKPKTVVDLREEMENMEVSLPESIYQVFQMAVEAHLTGRLETAQEYYERLRTISRRSGISYDLAHDSEVLKHNLQLLEGQFAARQRAKQRR